MPITTSKTLSFKKGLAFLWLCFFSLVVYGQPSISSFSPVSGPVGTTVTISGNNFNSIPANNIVFFGAVRANVTAATGTSLTVTVPSGATYQPLSVTVNGLTAFSFRAFNITFTGGGQINSSSFSPRTDFSTDLLPNGIAVADFDGDGKPDITTPNNYQTAGAASVSVLRNISSSGNISFAPKQDFVTGGITYCIAAGDLDGDGKPDIVSGSIGASNISVFRNTSSSGAINFAPKTDIPLTGGPIGNAPYSIAVSDIDGDGKADIVVLDNSSQNVSIFRNTGSVGVISFAAKIDFLTQLNPQGLAIGDLDGDGKTDIAITNRFSSSFSTYRNTGTSGNISFAARTDITVGISNEPTSITAGDLDGDGKADLAVAVNNTTLGGVQLYRNTSSPGNIGFSFSTFLPGASGSASFHSAMGDINGDGKPDIAFTSDASLNHIKVFQNNSVSGTISFGSSNGFNSRFAPYGIALCDLDADSKPDLTVSEFTMDNISVLKNKCGSPAVTSFNPTSGPANTTVTITGSNFTGVTGVKFGGVNAASFSVVNSSTITATVGAGASGEVEVTNAAGSGSLSGFVFIAPPVISSFTPTSAGPGATITITGTNFTGTTAVSFGGAAASSFTVVNSATITAVVANGASGNVRVTSPGGTGTLSGFVFIPAPVITSFNPISGGTGATITITGTNFTGATAVSFGGVAASSFTVVNATTITAVVGTGATGVVSVTTPGGVAALAGFTYIFPVPTITSFNPVSGTYGTTVTITGTNLTGATAVSFGGVAAISFTVVNSTTITAVAGTGASGNVSVTTPGGTASLTGFTYNLPPVISSFTPASGAVGSTVTINGLNFSNSPANNTVYFGAVKATVVSASSTQLTVTVPPGITYQPLSVTVNNLTGYSAQPFIVTFPGATGYFASNSFVLVTSNAAGSATAGTCIGDLDNDGKPDIITSNENSSNLSILRNTSSSGNISFAVKVDYSVGSFPVNVIASDINGDGKLDVIAGYQSKISIFKNTSPAGAILLDPPVAYDILAGPTCIDVCDLDGDGRPDIAASKNSSNTVSVLRNTGSNGAIAFGSEIIIDNNSSNGPSSNIKIEDIDRDGKPDIIAVNLFDNSVSVFRNTSTIGAISFATKINFPAGTYPLKVFAGDIDGDGKPDLLASHDDGFSLSYFAVTILRNTSTPGNISFSPFINIPTGSNPNAIAMQDLDGDGKSDVLVTNRSSDYFSVLRNNSTSGVISFSTPALFTSGFTSRSTGIADFDGDNKPDIAVSVGSGSNISVFKNKAGEAAGAAITSFSPASGGQGTSVTITGVNLTGATAVSFGGTPASSFTVVNATTVNAVVASGTSGAVSVVTPLGTAAAYGFTFITPPPPTITSFNPTSAASGATVTITGTNFTGATEVRFGGTAAASYSVVNATTITAVVGTGASGNVSVTTPGGTASASGFTFILPPTVSSFNPTSAASGTTVTITGTSFTGATAVNLGGIVASSFIIVNTTTITAIVGSGASGSVAVTTPGGTASLAGFTFIPAPTITSFTPTTAATGVTVTITGTNLTGATAVSFGGVAAQSFTVNSATSISAIVGAGASGNVSITTPGGTAAMAGFTYTIATSTGNPSNNNTKDLTVNPNPGDGVIVIKHPASLKTTLIRFVDITGKTIKEVIPARNANQTSTDVKSLSHGVYKIIWTDGKRLLSRTFMVK